jgi:AcrR family transcriptional regulator
MRSGPYLETIRFVSLLIGFAVAVIESFSVEQDAQSPRAGRPRSEGCRQRVLAAADELLGRDGFGRMSVDGIAQRAGVSKATIYRWWPNKAAIVMEAMLAATEAELQVPIGPSPEDLIERLRRTIALFRGDKARVLASLIGEAQFNPEVAEAYRKHLLAPRRAAMRGALERAISAGALGSGFDMDLALDQIFGPLYERLLLGHAPLDDAFERDYPPIAVAALRALSTHRIGS